MKPLQRTFSRLRKPETGPEPYVVRRWLSHSLKSCHSAASTSSKWHEVMDCRCANLLNAGTPLVKLVSSSLKFARL